MEVDQVEPHALEHLPQGRGVGVAVPVDVADAQDPELEGLRAEDLLGPALGPHRRDNGRQLDGDLANVDCSENQRLRAKAAEHPRVRQQHGAWEVQS